MNSLTKITLVTGIASLAVSIGFGIMDVRDARKGKKRMHKEDISQLAAEIALFQTVINSSNSVEEKEPKK